MFLIILINRLLICYLRESGEYFKKTKYISVLFHYAFLRLEIGVQLLRRGNTRGQRDAAIFLRLQGVFIEARKLERAPKSLQMVIAAMK